MEAFKEIIFRSFDIIVYIAVIIMQLFFAVVGIVGLKSSIKDKHSIGIAVSLLFIGVALAFLKLYF